MSAGQKHTNIEDNSEAGFGHHQASIKHKHKHFVFNSTFESYGPAHMRVIIIGGGIGGLCLANGLQKANVDVAVFERQPSANERLAGYGIHINEHGRRALRNCLGDASWHRFEAASTAAGTHLYFRDTNLQLLAEKDDAVLSGKPTYDVERRGIGRLELRDILLSGLTSAQGSVLHWNKTLSHYENMKDGRTRVHFTDGTYEDGDVIVGADGGHSRIREQYLPDIKRVDLGIVAIAGRYVLNRTRERALPMALTNGSLNNIVPNGKGWMFVSAWHSRQPTNSTGDEHYVVWAYVVPKLETPANVSKIIPLELREIALAGVENWCPSLATLVRDADVNTIAPISLRSMQHLGGWQSTNVTLLGDAIHAMTPMAGVGANTALRDADLLTQVLRDAASGQSSTTDATSKYESKMRVYANTAVSLSRLNAESASSGNQWSRQGFRILLRLAQASPAVMKATIGRNVAKA